MEKKMTYFELKNTSPPLSEEERIQQISTVLQTLNDYTGKGPEFAPSLTFYPPYKTNIVEEKAAIATIQQSNPTDIQAISASKLTLSNSFYNNALRQSQQSFLWSLIWAGVGALFIISTVTLVIVLQPTIATSVIIALLGGTGGVGSSAIAYATLQLYKQASEQAAACHIRLDRASDFILANSACEGLEGPAKQKMRSEIIRKLVE
jgi:hypothetical protein